MVNALNDFENSWKKFQKKIDTGPIEDELLQNIFLNQYLYL